MLCGMPGRPHSFSNLTNAVPAVVDEGSPESAGLEETLEGSVGAEHQKQTKSGGGQSEGLQGKSGNRQRLDE